MSQPNRDMRGKLLRNDPPGKPFDSLHADGNRGAGGGGQLIARADWSQHGLTPTPLPGYESTATWSTWAGAGMTLNKVSNYVEAVYSDTTGTNTSGGLSLNLEDLSIQEVFIEAKVSVPSALKGSSKFIKVFGSNAGTGYCNTTYGLESGVLQRISFGDGTIEGEPIDGNDTHRNIWFNGSNPAWTGRNNGVATILTKGSSFAFDSDVHTLQIHHQFHSGMTPETEQRNGVYKVNIDGEMYCNTSDVWNRYHTNSPNILMLNFFDWVQDSPAFVTRMSDIKISIGGFV